MWAPLPRLGPARRGRREKVAPGWAVDLEAGVFLAAAFFFLGRRKVMDWRRSWVSEAEKEDRSEGWTCDGGGGEGLAGALAQPARLKRRQEGRMDCLRLLTA